MKKIMRWAGMAMLILSAVAGSATAGGLYLYEVGSPDVGLAGAGYAARADDAATVFTNPAGMTRIDQPSLLMGVQPVYMNLEFSPDGNTSAAAATLPNGAPAKDGDTSGWMPAGGLYYVHPVNDRLRLGLSVNGYFGLSLDYESDWVGRYYLKEATLQGMAFQPAVAWKVNDWLSLGGGVAAIYGMLEEKVAVNNIDRFLGDGELKVEDQDWTAQFNLGVLTEPRKGTRFGLTYLSEAKLDFSDRVSWRGLGPGIEASLGGRGLLDARLDLGMYMPQAVMFSAYHEFTDRLALMANLGWQDWSRFGKVHIGVNSLTSNSLTVDMDYKDTWHVALGAEYKASDAWRITGGVAYDSDMVDESDVEPNMPVGENWRFGLGSRYDWPEDLSLTGAYELVWVGDIDMDTERGPLAGRVSGTYEDVSLHVFCLTLEWRF
jgi:long-chain fatty acid transport protein